MKRKREKELQHDGAGERKEKSMEMDILNIFFFYAVH